MTTFFSSSHFAIELDDAKLRQQIADSKQEFQGLADQVVMDAGRMDNAFDGVAKTVASLGMAWSLQEFANSVINVRKEIESLEVSFATLLGSEAKAKQLFGEIREFAVNTPMQLKDLASGAQTLLSFNYEADKTMGILKAIGDISMGDSAKFNSLTLAFSQMSATGKLMGQDLLQMINAGFNPLSVMAEKTGKSIKELKDEMSDGKISAQMVEQAFIDATSEGGKFYGMLEAQSHTISGAMSNLQGAVDDMFNAIGEGVQDTFTDAVLAATDLVKHYQIVGEALATLVASFGVYRATLMATTAFSNACYGMEIAQLKAVLAEKGAEIDADLAEAVAKGRLSAARAGDVQALRAELDAKIEVARQTAVLAQQEAGEATRKRMSAQLAYQKARAEVEAKQEEIFAMEGLYAHQTVETLTKEKDTLVTKMHALQEKFDAAAKAETAAKTKALTTAQAVGTLTTKKDTIAKKMNTQQTKILTLVTGGLKKAVDALKAAFATNPFGMILMGVTLVMGALMTMNDAMAETSEEITRFGEAAVKQSRNVDTLVAVIKNTSDRSKVHKNAVDELCQIYEEYGIHIDTEIDKMQQLIDKHHELKAAIAAEGEERQKANQIAYYENAINQATESMQKTLEEAYANAEWLGSGFLDDWDASVIQKKREEISAVVAPILRDGAEELAGLTGKAYADKLAEIKGRVESIFKDMGWERFKGLWKIDVDEIAIMTEYAKQVDNLKASRDRLVGSINRGREATVKEAEAVDYEKMSFDELFNAAYKAEDRIERLNVQKAKPTVSTTSIDAAIAQTDTLISNMLWLQGQGEFKMPKLDFNPKPQGLGLDWGGFTFSQQPQSPLGFNFSVSDYAAAGQAQIDAQKELEKRMVNALKTRKGTADLLKEVNTMLETAEAGSDDEKKLVAMRKRLQDQQKKFNGTTGKTETETERKAKIQKAELDAQKVLEDSTRARMEMQCKLKEQETQNEIDLEENASVRRIKQFGLDQAKERAALEQQKQRAIDEEIRRQKAIFDAQENAKAARDKTYVKKNFTEADIDKSQITAIVNNYARLEQQLVAKHNKALEDMKKADKNALNEYLREYGDYWQKRQAIAEQFAEKIKNAASIGERLSLEAQLEAAFKDLDLSHIQQNWKGVFDSLDTMSIEALQRLRQRMEDALDNKNLSPEVAKEFGTQLDKISGLLVQKKTEWTNLVGGAIGDVAKRIAETRQAQEDNARAQEALKKATEEEADAKQRVLDIQKEIAQLAAQQGIKLDTQNISTNSAADIMQQFANKGGNSQKMGDLFSKLGTAERGAAQATERLGTASQNATQALGKLKGAGGGAAGTITMIDTIVHGINDNIQSFMGVLKELGAEDSQFAKGMGKFAESSEYATKAWDSLKSGNIMGVAEGVLGSLRTLGEALGEWGFEGFGSSDIHLEEDIERLAKTNEALEYAIKELSDVMRDAAMTDVAELYYQQMALLNESEAGKRESMQRSGDASSNGFLGIGGHHSSNYKINEGMSSSEWERVSKVTKASVNSASDFWDLTSAQMRKLAIEAPDLYAKIKDLADDGYRDAGQFMDDYIEYAKKREDLEKAYYEKLTSVSFDSLHDEFKKALTDMNMSAEEFASNFQNLLIDSIAESLMTNKYDKKIKDLYKKWAGYMEDDGKLTAEEVAELQKDREAIYDSMQKDREFIRSLSMGDIVDQGGGTKKGFAAASQDSIDELNGRFTAIQMDTSIIRETLSDITASMRSMHLSTGEIKQHTDEIRNIALQALDYLSSISKNTFELFEINERLGKIEKNTSRI